MTSPLEKTVSVKSIMPTKLDVKTIINNPYYSEGPKCDKILQNMASSAKNSKQAHPSSTMSSSLSNKTSQKFQKATDRYITKLRQNATQLASLESKNTQTQTTFMASGRNSVPPLNPWTHK